MNYKKEKPASTGSTQLNNFLNSFNSNPKNIRFQCRNCKVWAKMHKFFPAALYDRQTNKMYLFRVCKDCYESMRQANEELLPDFYQTMFKNLQEAEETKR